MVVILKIRAFKKPGSERDNKNQFKDRKDYLVAAEGFEPSLDGV